MSIDKAKALKAAQKHLAKGQLDRAIVEYEKIVQDDPSDARSLLKLGDIYTRQGDQRGAATTYRKVASQYVEQGFFLKAMAVYKQILKLDPSDLSASEKLGEMYEMLSLTSDALSTYEYVAEAHARSNTPEKAIKVLGRLAELDGSNVATWIRYAELLSKTHRVEEAAEAFRRGADLLKSQGRFDDYIKVSERLLFHAQDDIPRARDLAQMYVERNQPKAALPHLQTCFKHDPKDPATLDLLARAFQSMGQRAKAASVYKELVRIHAEDGRDAEERSTLLRLSELEPENTEVSARLAVLGSASAELDDDDEQEVELDDIEMMDDMPPSERPAAYPLDQVERAALLKRLMAECEVFLRYGLRDKIVAQLNRVLELDPNHVEAREKLKETFLKRGEIDAAVQQLLLLSDGVAQNDPALALRCLEQAASLRPGNETVAVRLRLWREAAPPPIEHDTDEDPVLVVDDDESDFSDLASEPPTAIRPNELLLQTPSEIDGEPELMFEAGAEDALDVAQQDARASVVPMRAESSHFALAAAAHDDSVAPAQQAPDEDPEGLNDALEEATFYISQKLFEEAREVLEDALRACGDHPRLLAKFTELDEPKTQEIPVPQQVEVPATRARTLALDAASTAQGPIDVGHVLKQFKDGVRDQVETSDTSTHYDLGIAYMEMGLHGEAIEEFKLCLGSEQKKCKAHTMIGLSYVAKGEMQNGITHFKQAFAHPLRSVDEELDLCFEIGNAYELLEKTSEAASWYQKVEAKNPRFRNVSARLARLGSNKSDQQEFDEFDAMFDSMILKD